MDTTTLPPTCWRSEAFAEDLPDDVDSADAAGRGGHAPPGTVARQALLGGVPLLMAAAGALVSAWGGAT